MKKKHIAEVLLIAAVIAGFWLWGRGGREERKEELIAEARQCDAFLRHEDLLLEVIEREHEEKLRSNMDTVGGRGARATTFDEESYRAQMYRAMTQALTERGHERDAIDLDRFRARETTH